MKKYIILEALCIVCFVTLFTSLHRIYTLNIPLLNTIDSILFVVLGFGAIVIFPALILLSLKDKVSPSKKSQPKPINLRWFYLNLGITVIFFIGIPLFFPQLTPLQELWLSIAFFAVVIFVTSIRMRLADKLPNLFKK